MTTTFKLKRTYTASRVFTTSELAEGEMGVNITDKKIYVRDNSNSIILVSDGSARVSSFSGGTTGLTPNSPTTGAIVLSGTLAVANGGTGNTTNTAAGLSSGASIPGALQSVATGLTATGTNQGTGLALTSDINYFTTVAAGTAAVLPTAVGGKTMYVINKGANALLLFPASSGTIDALSSNASITVPASTWITLEANDTAHWTSSLTLAVPSTSLSGLALTGDVTGTISAGSVATTLAASGVSANMYGSATQTPVITVDAKGRVTLVTNTTIVPTSLASGASTPGALQASATGLTATGTNQGNALALTSDINYFTTVASGTGAVLPTSAGGKTVYVINKGANALLLYPASSGTIDALSANTAISIPASTWVEFLGNDTTHWSSSLTAAISASSIVGSVTDSTKMPLAGGTFTGQVIQSFGASIASASTVNLTTATGNILHITGAGTINAFTVTNGMDLQLIFDGINTLVNSSSLICLGGANITTAAGDACVIAGDGTNARIVDYQKADGTALIATAASIPDFLFFAQGII